MEQKPNPVNLEEIKLKLYEMLKPSGWGDKLKTFILSEDLTKILAELHRQSTSGERFTPILKQVFRAFVECPYSKLTTILIGQDVYPAIGQADGLAFSCSNTKKPAVSLQYIFREIEDTVYKDNDTEDPDKFAISMNPDLTRWANQGVLLLNTALTTTVGKIGAHYDIWRPFIAFLLDMLKNYNPGLVYVFLGKKAEEWKVNVGDNNYKLFTTHPAYAAYTKSKTWNSGDVFNKINTILFDKYGNKITW